MSYLGRIDHYRRKKQKGRCMRCGGEKEPERQDKNECLACVEWHKKYQAKYKEKENEKVSECQR